MYNLLMASQDNSCWEKETSFQLECDRFLEFTDETTRLKFLSHPQKLKKFPCLFTHEGSPKEGIVGEILSISEDEQTLVIDYNLPDNPIRFSFDESSYMSLNIGNEGYERNRNYWAVKKINLYKTISEIFNRRPPQNLSYSEIKNIWKSNAKTRIFLSHKAEYRKNVSNLAKELEQKNISCFVAHTSIPPASLWNIEIIKALSSMYIFVALITNDFDSGGYTNQEVGYAIAKGVPRFFIKLGSQNPKGFVHIEQAMEASWDNLSKKLVERLEKDKLI